MQIWQLLISISWISSTKEMNPITRKSVSKLANTAKFQSCRPNTRRRNGRHCYTYILVDKYRILYLLGWKDIVLQNIFFHKRKKEREREGEGEGEIACMQAFQRRETSGERSERERERERGGERGRGRGRGRKFVTISCSLTITANTEWNPFSTKLTKVNFSNHYLDVVPVFISLTLLLLSVQK